MAFLSCLFQIYHRGEGLIKENYFLCCNSEVWHCVPKKKIVFQACRGLDRAESDALHLQNNGTDLIKLIHLIGYLFPFHERSQFQRFSS